MKLRKAQVKALRERREKGNKADANKARLAYIRELVANVAMQGPLDIVISNELMENYRRGLLLDLGYRP